jgi:hypothetical protein
VAGIYGHHSHSTTRRAAWSIGVGTIGSQPLHCRQLCLSDRLRHTHNDAVSLALRLADPQGISDE